RGSRLGCAAASSRPVPACARRPGPAFPSAERRGRAFPEAWAPSERAQHPLPVEHQGLRFLAQGERFSQEHTGWLPCTRGLSWARVPPETAMTRRLLALLFAALGFAAAHAATVQVVFVRPQSYSDVSFRETAPVLEMIEQELKALGERYLPPN